MGTLKVSLHCQHFNLPSRRAALSSHSVAETLVFHDNTIQKKVNKIMYSINELTKIIIIIAVMMRRMHTTENNIDKVNETEDGNEVGNVVGNEVGNEDGNVVGTEDGNVVGNEDGNEVSNMVGNEVGNVVGNEDGNVVSNEVGNVVGNSLAHEQLSSLSPKVIRNNCGVPNMLTVLCPHKLVIFVIWT